MTRMVNRAIIAFPRTNALDAIEGLRRRFDPLAEMITAHITLVFPFTSDSTAGELRSHIEHTIAGLGPFQVRLVGITAVDDEYVFLNVGDGRDRVIQLHDRLYTGALASHLSREHVYSPHVTLGRLRDGRAAAHALAEAIAVAPGGNSTIQDISVFRLDGPDRGVIEFTVSLADAETT